MRIDKLLWFLRLAPSRSFAQQWVLGGHIRLNGVHVSKPAAAIALGDVLTLPMRNAVKIIEVVALPTRRGPASEAQGCYRTLDEPRRNPIAAADTNSPDGSRLP